MSKRKALGKGLGALLPSNEEPANAGILMIAVNLISPNPHQPRTQFEPVALQELADSITEHGIIQPLIVTESDKGRYILIAGERRWRASQLVGLKEVPVVVKDVSPQDQLEWALIENIQRADLNPIEEAIAYQQLVDEFGLTQTALAKRVGKSRSEVANRLGLLKLPADIQQTVTDGRLSYGHARVLVGLPTPEAQRSLMKTILKKALSVRQAEEIARKMKKAEPLIRKQKTKHPPHIISVENQLRDHLGAQVSVQRNKDGAGRVVIHFYNDEDLQTIYEMILQNQPS